MSNHLTNGLKNNESTPIRCLGLSRKRKSSCLNNNNSVCSSKNTETCFESEIKKQNISSTEISHKNLQVEENFQNKSESKSEIESGILDMETKYVREIKELENLYSIWANGFKNAFSYLLNLLEIRPGDLVNVKQLLMQLRIWEVISDHFKNDSELCCFLKDGEDSD